MGYFILTLVVLAIAFALIGLENVVSPVMGGWGAALAFVLGFIILAYMYAINNSMGRYDVQVLLGIVGGILFYLINLPFILPFGQAIVNLWSYGNFAGELAAVIVVLSFLVLLWEAFSNTKRVDLV